VVRPREPPGVRGPAKGDPRRILPLAERVRAAEAVNAAAARCGATPSRLPRAVRRDQLLDATAALILEHGLDAVTMEAVADRVGVSKTLGYAYFTDRIELLTALWDRESSVVDQRLRVALDGQASFEQGLRCLAEAACDVALERGRLIGVLMAAPIDARLTVRTTGRARAEARRIAKMITAQYHLADDVAEVESALVLAACQRSLGYVVEHPESRAVAIDTLVRATIGGLRALAGCDAAHPDALGRSDR